MITAVHALIYARDADQVRTFLREVLGWSSVDAHPGWPIFTLPPAEVGVHPTDGAGAHELYLMCDDLAATMRELETKGVAFAGEPHEESWGIVTRIVLPGGGELGLYQPRHPVAAGMSSTSPAAPRT